MAQIKQRVMALICTLVCLLLLQTQVPAKPTNAESHGQKATVRAWFKEYDQIRRSAESTKQEKLQAMSFGKNEPSKANTELATRMLEKYTSAAAAMKQLQSTPETSELQDGYIQYFTTGRQFFADYLDAQKATPFSGKALVTTKKNLQALHKTNKGIDAQLRTRFKIPKHKHI